MRSLATRRAKPRPAENTRRSFTLRLRGPFDLRLSLAVAASFAPSSESKTADMLRIVLPLGATMAPVEYRQRSTRPPLVDVVAHGIADRSLLKRATEAAIAADLDLRPFYRLVRDHPVLGPLTKSLRGLKPLRPASLFEMAVVAITEQQISLAAAYHMRQRLVARYGRRMRGGTAFPRPEELAKAPLRGLHGCGLSHRKAEYIRALARDVAAGRFDLGALRDLSDEAARQSLCTRRGLGPWTADYILVRGLGRMDCIPFDDLGVRDAVGLYLGRGKRVSPEAAERLTRRFKPYRGLAIFYLLAAMRLERLGWTALHAFDNSPLRKEQRE